MNSRILTVAEWGQESTEPSLLPYVSPRNAAVVVVEDEGKVVARMTVLQVTHFEGAWIDPAHCNAGVTRALLRQALAIPKVRQEKWVFCGCADGRMEKILGRLGATKVPMDTYVLPIEEEPCLKPS